MYTLKVKPENGTLYEITHNYGKFAIVRIDGIDPPMNSVHVSTAGNMDGGIFNSARLEPRNIVITAVLYGNIEQSRQELYSIFPQKSSVTVFFKDKNRNLKTVGYVEKPACNPFELRETAQISLICPDPYWHDSAETTAELAAFEPVTIDNTGDVSTGFSCTVEFSTDNPPSVTLAEESDDLQAVFPFRRNVFLQPMSSGTPVTFDPDTQRIGELMTANEDITDKIAAASNILKEDDLSGTNAETFVRVEMSSDVLASGTYRLDYAIYGIENGSAENVECTVWTSTNFSDSGTPSIYNANINFDGAIWGTNYDSNTDVIKVYLRNSSGWILQSESDYILGGEYTTSHRIYAHFNYNLIGAGYTAGKLVVYHDSTAADIRSTLQLDYFSETRNVLTDWSANCFDSIPAGFDADKNVPYINGERITAADISECYIIPESGTAEAYSIIYGDPGNAVDFRYVYSLNGDDITAYTDTEIDAGLIGTEFTEGLTLWNNTTGDWMQFKNTRFQLGDVLEICTVKGQLRAAITERDGQAADISLLSDVYKSGYFFQLERDENEIQITATSGSENVSATMTAEFLHGGA